MDVPKYSRLENERRFLAALPAEFDLSGTCTHIKDVYVIDSRLRLRAATDSSTGSTVYKFCKKYSAHDPVSGPIVNMYLTAEEYGMLSRLPGRTLVKRRYRVEYMDVVFGLDVFDEDLAGLILCEAEMPTREQVCALQFPPFATKEVTEDPFFTGGNLCRATPAELRNKLGLAA